MTYKVATNSVDVIFCRNVNIKQISAVTLLLRAISQNAAHSLQIRYYLQYLWIGFSSKVEFTNIRTLHPENTIDRFMAPL